MRAWWVLIVLVSCGSRAQLDGTTDASTTNAGFRCDPNAPFTNIERLDSSFTAPGSEATDFRLTSDELHAYFSKSNFAGWHLATADRDSSNAFGAPTWISSIETLPADAGYGLAFGSPNISDDELTLLFEADGNDCSGEVAGVGHIPTSICVATRANVGSSFSAPTVVHFGAGDLDDPYAIHGGSRLYVFEGPWSSPRGIGFADRVDTSHYGAITLVPIDFGSDSGSLVTRMPIVTPDELTLFFVRLGSNSIWQATRKTTSESFTNARPLTELGDNADPSWVSPDGCRLYHSRSETGVGVDLHVYVAHRAQ